MNELTHSGDMCPECEGTGQLVIVEGFHSETSMCHDCIGLGWLPQPGDALTFHEAVALWPIFKEKILRQDSDSFAWHPMERMKDFTICKDDLFRIAPAQEHPAEKGEEFPAPIFTARVSDMPQRVEVLPLVLADLSARIEKGAKQYGERLTTHNGRPALWDAYEEALDLCLYLRQAIEESLTPAQLEALRQERKA